MRFSDVYLSLTLRGDASTETYINMGQIAMITDGSGGQGTEIVLDCGEKVIVAESLDYVYEEMSRRLESLKEKR